MLSVESTSEVLAASPRQLLMARLLEIASDCTLQSVYIAENIKCQIYWRCEDATLAECLKAMQRDTKGTYCHERNLEIPESADKSALLSLSQ